MNVVFEPSLLFISETNWQEEERRDNFLDNLETHLNIIDKYDISEILWTEELESLLWETPQLNPWKQEYWSFMPIITNIFKKLNSRKNYSFVCAESPCLANPSFKQVITEHQAHELFLKLVHTLNVFQINFYLCVGIENRLSKLAYPNEYNFYCNCHNIALKPILINKASDFLHYIDIESFFPKTIVEFDEKFEKGLELIKNRDFADKNYLVPFEFSQNFKRSIIDRKTFKEEIFIAIVKRLILTSQELANSNLNNEFITKNSLNEWRIRVTQRPSSTRIHYIITIDNKIKFLQYYGEGEHDDAL